MKRLAMTFLFCLLVCQFAIGQSFDGCFTSTELFKLYQSSPEAVSNAMAAAKWLPIYDNNGEKFIYGNDTLTYAAKSWKYTMSYDDIFLKFYSSDTLPNFLQVQIAHDCFQGLLNEIKATHPCVKCSEDSLEQTYWKSNNCSVQFSERHKNTTFYFVQYFNSAEMDSAVARIQRQRQQALELQRQRELQVKNILRAADSLRALEQYDLAISQLEPIKNLVPAMRQNVENKIALLNVDIKNKKVKNLLSEGDELFAIKKYDESKKKYKEILTLDPGNETAKNSIEKVERIQNVLEARKTTVYDYKTLNPNSYNTMIDLLQDHLNDFVNETDQGHLQFKMNLAYDTLGVNKSSFVKFANSDPLPSFLDDMLKSSAMFPTLMEGIYVASLKSRTFDIKWNSAMMTAKKANEKKITVTPRTLPTSAELISQTISKNEDYPTGRYIFSVKEKHCGDSLFSSVALTQYKTVGGEAMFYSMLYPGVGTLAATQGKRGWTALSTFTVFMGGTITSLIFSKRFADKAQLAGEGSDDFNKYNKKSNTLKWTHYICGGATAVIYVSDVFTALIKGCQNKKKSKYLRNSLKYNPIQVKNENLIIQ